MCSFSQGLKLWFVSKSMLHTHKHSFFYVKTGRGSFMQLGFMSVVHRRVRTCANGNSFGRSFSLSCCKIKERPASFWGFSSPEVWGKQNWLVFRLYLRHFNGVQFETLPDLWWHRCVILLHRQGSSGRWEMRSKMDQISVFTYCKNPTQLQMSDADMWYVPFV